MNHVLAAAGALALAFPPSASPPRGASPSAFPRMTVGADRAPAGRTARFWELTGILLDPARARRTTNGGTLALARGEVALFIGDSGRIALMFVGEGAPLLCMPG